MEVTIDKAIQHIKNSCYIVGYPTHDKQDETRKKINASLDMAIDTMRKYQKIKADYENRLKTDMVAMLTEIQLEIEELKNEPACCQHYKRGVNQSSDIIQQKINSLKE